MQPGASFPQQFFALSSVLPEGRVVLAGGLYPLAGSRSAYRASVACYDYRAEKIVWLWEQTKSYPFRAVAHTRDVCGAMLDQSFVRCPIGLFRFGLASGEPLQPAGGVEGWKVLYVDATDDTFLFSRVHHEISYVRVVNGRDGTFQERSFPYPANSNGKTLERVLATGNESFVALFSLVKGDRVVRLVERWDFPSPTPQWKLGTKLSSVVRNESALLLWEPGEPQLDVGVVDIESGVAKTGFRLALPFVVSIRPVDEQTYAVLSRSGVYLLNASSQRLSPLVKFDDPDSFDFGGLAVDLPERKLVCMTTGNHQRPGTCVRVFDF